MASTVEIQRALKALKARRSTIGHSHSHHHEDEDVENDVKRRLLEGLCGNCKSLNITLHPGDVATTVGLHCQQGVPAVDIALKLDPPWLPFECNLFEAKPGKWTQDMGTPEGDTAPDVVIATSESLIKI